MQVVEEESKTKDSGESARDEYGLAVKTQMHFNEILMKFRSFGVTVVVAVYSYAIGRPPGEVIVGSTTASQAIALVGVCLTFVLAVLDLAYFLPLLVGSVSRSLELEKSIGYRLTSSISRAVSKKRAYGLMIAFYLFVGAAGLFLHCVVLPHLSAAAVPHK
jgi:hypothetical protein